MSGSNSVWQAKSNAAVLDLSAYAGNWVAVVSGHVVGVGKSAHAALLAARYQRVKEEPGLIWVPRVDSDESPRSIT